MEVEYYELKITSLFENQNLHFMIQKTQLLFPYADPAKSYWLSLLHKNLNLRIKNWASHGCSRYSGLLYAWFSGPDTKARHKPIEEGLNKKTRHRLSHRIGGQNPCRASCFVSASVKQTVELNCLFQKDRCKTARAARGVVELKRLFQKE